MSQYVTLFVTLALCVTINHRTSLTNTLAKWQWSCGGKTFLKQPCRAVARALWREKLQWPSDEIQSGDRSDTSLPSSLSRVRELQCAFLRFDSSGALKIGRVATHDGGKHQRSLLTSPHCLEMACRKDSYSLHGLWRKPNENTVRNHCPTFRKDAHSCQKGCLIFALLLLKTVALWNKSSQSGEKE